MMSGLVSTVYCSPGALGGSLPNDKDALSSVPLNTEGGLSILQSLFVLFVQQAFSPVWFLPC